ncbi:hypothetical protein G8A07_00385 [Roseateles sp. DAIF2]|uniref:EF-Tu/IF-2/RF-3 family GTPase n=1 Tax=Roseateles sp. DAIF2 TaxID=2714952 RepID=UPI0018A294C6|nr:EF-Tu/IF-2/RF-3 family GTPase [Roseateles sp. DAIF2]QPF71527.1 hypothetical protein G8A07_00385 [Roseateles sp. DAIF2]
MSDFRFTSNDVFVIFRTGVVFHGIVESGSVSKGDHVSLLTQFGPLVARVEAIELDRKLIPTSIAGAEIGLLLANFDRESVNVHVGTLVDESNFNTVPTVESVLGIQVPVTLERMGK